MVRIELDVRVSRRKIHMVRNGGISHLFFLFCLAFSISYREKPPREKMGKGKKGIKGSPFVFFYRNAEKPKIITPHLYPSLYLSRLYLLPHHRCHYHRSSRPNQLLLSSPSSSGEEPVLSSKLAFGQRWNLWGFHG